jgi:hypothetical protein
MKPLLVPILASFGAWASPGHAFTVDAIGYEGGEWARDPISMWVHGYGQVVLEDAAAVVIESAYSSCGDFHAAPLHFDKGEAVRISLDGAGGGGGPAGFPQMARTEGDDVEPSVWSAIPEPASAALGLIGMLALLLGRFRGV